MFINKEKEHDINSVKQEEFFLKESSNSFGMNKMNQQTVQAIEDIEYENLYGGFSSAEELIKSLNK